MPPFESAIQDMDSSACKPKIIAFYLPQFHPIQENSSWWGDGFTEWHNVARARPLFRGHTQPKLPGELGFYDLRLERTRVDQAALAQQYGIFGFCYWHYWFDGRRLLETPIEQISLSGRPKFPFCLGWANESWTGVWHGSPRSVLVAQTYSDGDADRHYDLLRKYFHDERYIKHQGKPLFYVYKPRLLPADGAYLKRLRERARLDGFPDLFILGTWTPNPGGRFRTTVEIGLDGAVVTNISGRETHSRTHWLDAISNKLMKVFGGGRGPIRISYADAISTMLPSLKSFPFLAYNTVISNWDNTPRSGRRGLVLTGSTPKLFQSALEIAISNLRDVSLAESGHFIFLKSWNEWAEGNYIEPDQENGRGYLEAVKSALHVGQPRA